MKTAGNTVPASAASTRPAAGLHQVVNSAAKLARPSPSCMTVALGCPVTSIGGKPIDHQLPRRSRVSQRGPRKGAHLSSTMARPKPRGTSQRDRPFVEAPTCERRRTGVARVRHISGVSPVEWWGFGFGESPR